jgi:hypothetical protein
MKLIQLGKELIAKCWNESLWRMDVILNRRMDMTSLRKGQYLNIYRSVSLLLPETGQSNTIVSSIPNPHLLHLNVPLQATFPRLSSPGPFVRCRIRNKYTAVDKRHAKTKYLIQKSIAAAFRESVVECPIRSDVNPSKVFLTRRGFRI